MRHLLDGHRLDRPAAHPAVRGADAREEHAQVIVDFGHGSHGRPGIVRRGLLLDGDRGRESLDGLDLGLGHLLEKLSGVCAQRLYVSPLALGVEGVERERRLAGARDPGDDHKLVPGDHDVDPFEIMLRCSFDLDVVLHVSLSVRRGSKAETCRIDGEWALDADCITASCLLP